MAIEPLSTNSHRCAAPKGPGALIFRFAVSFPFTLLKGTGRVVFYCVWYLAFYLLCMFRPFTGMMMLAAIVMLPMSIVVFAHPEAAAGMPFWTFGLMALGLVAFSVGYTMLVDWFAPPGAEDPFERYRRRR
ncbi:hypothetical protein [Phyllobacterium zundukense]|uniref:Uncharacterized protein n=1 Tax=Phyllobacterium zundukense TaxID=1867719 RepID=A0ACD4CW94_9HYPH|nr:hypothetical protein [Phyllobacterium zundukense]UXN57738.1 hypothetical protein N8E88_02700 [Phyllobacterium zundukense]